MTREIRKHRCRWLYRPERKPMGMKGRYDHREGRPSALLFCWQTGKNLRTKYCVPCLLTRNITVLAGGGLPHKQPMMAKDWNKRHRKKD